MNIKLIILLFIFFKINSIFSYINKSPIILVPGLGGSVLYNKYNQKIWPPDQIFSKPNSLLSNIKDDISCNSIECLENISLKTKIGDSKGLIGNDLFSRFILKDTFYDKFIKNFKPYCFAYDFRLIMNPIYINYLYDKFTKFIDNFEEPVIVYCHSLGGLLFHDFLINKDKIWVKNKIKKIIYINTPFDGSPLVYKYLLEPKYKMLPFYKNIDLIGGLYWCLPWYNTDKEIIEFNNKNFIIKDIPKMTKLKKEYYDFLYKRKFDRLKENHVPSIILYSNTTLDINFYSIKLNNNILDEYNLLGGDNTVPYSSLILPSLYWKNLKMIKFQNTNHNSILQSNYFLDVCKDINIQII